MQNLIKTDEFFKTIDLIITPVIIANKATRHLYFNKAFRQDIGYSVDFIPDLETWYEVAYPDTAYRTTVRQQWETQQTAASLRDDRHIHLVAKIKCANNLFCWYDIHESVFGDYRVITFLNIDALQESHAELLDALKQKDILLSIIAHDVRSPLSNIQQIVSNYEQMALSAEEVRDLFSRMGVQIEYIFSIINSLLVRTSTDRGAFIEKSEELNLLAFYLKYTAYYKDRLEQKNVNLKIRFSGHETMNFDPFVLDMISRNLIDNAIKYSPKDGTVEISFKSEDAYSDILIRDDGPGMSVQQTERILQNQGSRRLTSQITDSFGLGLVMAKEILERNNGELLVDSKPGEGTIFTIRIQRPII